MPVVGYLEVVIDWPEKATSISKTIQVGEVSVKDVTAEFARTKGMGDGSLE